MSKKLLRLPSGKIKRQANGKLLRAIAGAPCCRSCYYGWGASWVCEDITVEPSVPAHWTIAQMAEFPQCKECPPTVDVFKEWVGTDYYKRYYDFGVSCICNGQCVWPANPAPPLTTPPCTQVWYWRCTYTCGVGWGSVIAASPATRMVWSTLAAATPWAGCLIASCTTLSATPPSPPAYTPQCNYYWEATLQCCTATWSITKGPIATCADVHSWQIDIGDPGPPYGYDPYHATTLVAVCITATSSTPALPSPVTCNKRWWIDRDGTAFWVNTYEATDAGEFRGDEDPVVVQFRSSVCDVMWTRVTTCAAAQPTPPTFPAAPPIYYRWGLSCATGAVTVVSLGPFCDATVTTGVVTTVAPTAVSGYPSYYAGNGVDDAGTAPTNVQTDDGDTSYRNLAPGRGDFLTYDSIPADATNISVVIKVVARALVSDHDMQFWWKIGSTEYSQDVFAITTSYAEYASTPISLASAAAANALKAGVGTETGGRYTKIELEFTYDTVALKDWTDDGRCGDTKETTTDVAPDPPANLPTCLKVYTSGCDGVISDGVWTCFDADFLTTHPEITLCTWGEIDPITCVRTWYGDGTCEPTPTPLCPDWVNKWVAIYDCAAALWSVALGGRVKHAVTASWADPSGRANAVSRVRVRYTTSDTPPSPPSDTPGEQACPHIYRVTQKRCHASGRGWDTRVAFKQGDMYSPPETLDSWFDAGNGWYEYWTDMGLAQAWYHLGEDARGRLTTPELSHPAGTCVLSTGYAVTSFTEWCTSAEGCALLGGTTYSDGSGWCVKSETYVGASSPSDALTLNCWIYLGTGTQYSSKWVKYCVDTFDCGTSSPPISCDGHLPFAHSYCKMKWRARRLGPLGEGMMPPCYDGVGGEWEVVDSGMPFCGYEDVDDNTWIPPQDGSCWWTYMQRTNVVCDNQPAGWCANNATFTPPTPPEWP